MTNRVECDLAILGGGLAGSLIALAFAARRPDVRLALVERDRSTHGNLFSAPKMKGWLLKQGGAIKTWKRRW